MGTSVGTLQTSVGTLQTSVGTLQTSVSTLTTSVSTLTTSNSSLQTSVSTLTTSVGTLQTNVGTLETNVGTLETTLSGLQTSFETLVNDLVTYLTALEARIVALEGGEPPPPPPTRTGWWGNIEVNITGGDDVYISIRTATHIVALDSYASNGSVYELEEDNRLENLGSILYLYVYAGGSYELQDYGFFQDVPYQGDGFFEGGYWLQYKVEDAKYIGDPLRFDVELFFNP